MQDTCCRVAVNLVELADISQARGGALYVPGVWVPYGALYVLVGAERLPLAGDSLDTGRYASAHLGASPTEPSSSPPTPPPSPPPPPPSY